LASATSTASGKAFAPLTSASSAFGRIASSPSRAAVSITTLSFPSTRVIVSPAGADATATWIARVSAARRSDGRPRDSSINRSASFIFATASARGPATPVAAEDAAASATAIVPTPGTMRVAGAADAARSETEFTASRTAAPSECADARTSAALGAAAWDPVTSGRVARAAWNSRRVVLSVVTVARIDRPLMAAFFRARSIPG